MDTTTDVESPKLAPPGAGLPAPELFVARQLFAWTRWTGSREKFTRVFIEERERVLALARTCSGDTGARRILIKRIAGMEDSSRFWSVWMTLDHLRLIHHGIARTIQTLGKGSAPEGRASTAAVKPSPNADETSIHDFERSCALVLKRAAEVDDLKTKNRYIHPWFGPLNALGWYAMAGFHLKLHRTQIERILAHQSSAD